MAKKKKSKKKTKKDLKLKPEFKNQNFFTPSKGKVKGPIRNANPKVVRKTQHKG